MKWEVRRVWHHDSTKAPKLYDPTKAPKHHVQTKEAPRPDQSPAAYDQTKALRPTTRPNPRGRILKSGGLVPVGDGVGDVDQVVGDSLNI